MKTKPIIFTASNGSQIIDFRFNAEIRKDDESYLIERIEKEKKYNNKRENNNNINILKKLRRLLYARVYRFFKHCRIWQ